MNRKQKLEFIHNVLKVNGHKIFRVEKYTKEGTEYNHYNAQLYDSALCSILGAIAINLVGCDILIEDLDIGLENKSVKGYTINPKTGKEKASLVGRRKLLGGRKGTKFILKNPTNPTQEYVEAYQTEKESSDVLLLIDRYLKKIYITTEATAKKVINKTSNTLESFIDLDNFDYVLDFQGQIVESGMSVEEYRLRERQLVNYILGE